MPRILSLLVLLVLHGCGTQPQTSQSRVNEGDRLLAQGDTAHAVTAYRLALVQDSLNPDILARLGRIYAGQGNAVAADTYLRRAADRTYQQGLQALQTGEEAGAIAAFEHTLAIIPAHPLALLRLGDLFLAKGQEDQALSYFEQAIQANSDYPEGFVKAGKLYLRRRQFPQAQQAFEQAIGLNINARDAYLGLGELYVLQLNWKAAAEQYRKVLLIDPGSPVAKDALERMRSHL